MPENKKPRFIGPCYQPSYEPEGGLYADKHNIGEDGFCRGCGMPEEKLIWPKKPSPSKKELK